MRRVLTFDEACERVGKSVRTMRLWINRGYLRPIYRYGRRDLYCETDVLEADRLVRRGYPPPHKPYSTQSTVNGPNGTHPSPAS